MSKMIPAAVTLVEPAQTLQLLAAIAIADEAAGFAHQACGLQDQDRVGVRASSDRRAST